MEILVVIEQITASVILSKHYGAGAPIESD